MAARRLARGLRSLDRDGRVVLIDRDLTYRFAPSFLWVMTGARRPEQITSDLGRLGRWGIRAVRADVLEIDVEGRGRRPTIYLAYALRAKSNAR